MSHWIIFNPLAFTNLFKWTYYFDDNLTLMFLGWGYWVILAFLILCVVAAFWLPRRSKTWPVLRRQLALRTGHLAAWVGWTGLIWLFFRYEGVRYLSWRFWPTILLIYVLVELVLMVKYARVDFPLKRASKVSGQEKEKYLRRYLDKK